jgi:chromosome segregation ATPase
MTVDINELFEEGITRAGELTAATDAAIATIDEIAKAAAALSQRIEEEGNAAGEHLRDLTARLQQAEAELAEARGEAERAVDAVADRAREVAADVVTLLERVKTSVAGVESRVDQAGKAMDADLTTTQEAFQSLANRAQETDSEAQRQLAEAGQAIADLRDAVAKAHTELADRHAAWSAAAESLDDGAHQHAEAWGAGLEALMSRHETAMAEATDAMVDQHNSAMDALKQRFVVAAPQDLAAALAPLRAGVEQLGETADARAQSLASEVQELEQWVSQTIPIVDLLQGAVDSTSRLG